MQAIILCAGKGSRLHPLTASRSKAMLPILGKPMVERVMEQITANGVRDFILVAGPGDLELVEYFDRHCALPANVQVIIQEQPRGSADALRCAGDLIEADFLLSACDNLTSPAHIHNLLHTWHGPKRIEALLTLMPVTTQQASSTAIVELDGDLVTQIIEKPRLGQAPSNIASLPLYCFSNQILDYLPGITLSGRGEYELQDAIQMLIERDGRVSGIFVKKRFTLTNPADLLAINRHYLNSDQSGLLPVAGQAGAGTQFRTPVFIEPGARIGSECTIGPHVFIEGDCIIEDRVSIRDAVILRGSRIPAGTLIEGRIFGDR